MGTGRPGSQDELSQVSHSLSLAVLSGQEHRQAVCEWGREGGRERERERERDKDKKHVCEESNMEDIYKC